MLRFFLCSLLVFEWGVGHLLWPPAACLCFKCRSAQEWSLTKCKRLHCGHKYASSLSQDFAHIVHIVCAYCAFQQTFLDGQLFMLHFLSWFVCPQAQQNLVLGQLQSAVVILVSTAAQQCLTSVSASSNFKVMLENDTLIEFVSQQLSAHTWEIKHLNQFKTNKSASCNL